MKSVLIIFFIVCLLPSCRSKEEIYLPSDIKKVMIIEFNNFVPEHKAKNDSLILDPDYESIMGLIEINKDFNMKITQRLEYRGDYMSVEHVTSDQMRTVVLQAINRFESDSIDMSEDTDYIYDGYSYFMLIEKEDGNNILLGGYPKAISPELNEISSFLKDSAKVYVNKRVENQDSIRNYIRQYDKYRPKEIQLPPIDSYIQNVKFTLPKN